MQIRIIWDYELFVGKLLPRIDVDQITAPTELF